MLAIIGGSGLSELTGLVPVRRELVRTPYGAPSAALTFGRFCDREVIFLPRHGDGHAIPPHAVNYRANIRALASRGVGEIIAVATVGGIRRDLGPGTIAIPSQIIDYTYGRDTTFFDGVDGVVRHIDFTHPYCPRLRADLLRACAAANEAVVDGGVYGVTQGPRLETAAEIDRLERDGADMVGMTGMPETALARESGLSYAAIAVVVNWAAGRADSREGIAHARIEAVLQATMIRVTGVLMRCVEARHGD